MKVLVINLRRNPERRAQISARLGELGVPFSFVEAVDGRCLTEEVKASSANRFRWWCSTGLMPRDGEIGCGLSHAAIYRGMTEPCLCILEDDAVLCDDFPSELAQIEKSIDTTKPEVILLSNFRGWLRFADGYVITRSAARALLRLNVPMKRPCDHWSAWVRQNGLEVRHWPRPVVSQTFATSDTGRAPTLAQMSLLGKIRWKAKRAFGLATDEILARILGS